MEKELKLPQVEDTEFMVVSVRPVRVTNGVYLQFVKLIDTEGNRYGVNLYHGKLGKAITPLNPSDCITAELEHRIANETYYVDKETGERIAHKTTMGRVNSSFMMSNLSVFNSLKSWS